MAMLQETWLEYAKGWRKIHHANTNQKKAGVGIFRVDFKAGMLPGMKRRIA